MKIPVKIPKDAELLIKSGQTVDFGTPFHRSKGKKMTRIALAETLGFKPEKIFIVLKKGVGDKVKKGDLLAEHQAMFSTKQYLSSVNGIIKEIDHNLGTVTLELDSDDAKVTMCFFSGQVDTVMEDHIEVKVKRSSKFDTLETKNYLGGAVYYINDINKPLTEENISQKCIFGISINPLDQTKIETLGARAFITHTNNLQNISLKQIILQNGDDFEHIQKEKYPFCIMGVDKKSIYFYE